MKKRIKYVQSKPKHVTEYEEFERLYEQYLKKSKTEDLSDIAKLNIIYQSGVDIHGRPVVVIIGWNLPVEQLNMDRVLLYMIRVMHPIAERDFIIIYLHSDQSSNQPELGWLKYLYNIWDRKYNHNLKSLSIIHPTFWFKVFINIISPFVSASFSEKIKFVDRLIDVYANIDASQLQLPDKIFRYDTKLNGITKYPKQGESHSIVNAHEDL